MSQHFFLDDLPELIDHPCDSAAYNFLETRTCNQCGPATVSPSWGIDRGEFTYIAWIDPCFTRRRTRFLRTAGHGIDPRPETLDSSNSSSRSRREDNSPLRLPTPMDTPRSWVSRAARGEYILMYARSQPRDRAHERGSSLDFKLADILILALLHARISFVLCLLFSCSGLSTAIHLTLLPLYACARSHTRPVLVFTRRYLSGYLPIGNKRADNIDGTIL